MPKAFKASITAASCDERARQLCLPMLGALAKPGAVLEIGDGGASVGGRNFTIEVFEVAAARGWIEVAGDGCGWKIARAGAAVVRAARASGIAARATASAPDAKRATDRPRDSRAAATREAGGSLAWLHHRRDKDGQPMISAEQLAAGERLAGDLWRARMTPRVTSVWTGVPGDAGGRRGAPGAGIDITDAVIAAEARVERALKAVGPEFAGPLIDVCGHMLGLDDIERLNNLPMRSGKMLLRTALTRLARHYGLLPPEHGEAEIARRIAGWMSEDGGVTLEGWGDR